jgi:hypothetical protein
MHEVTYKHTINVYNSNSSAKILSVFELVSSSLVSPLILPRRRENNVLSVAARWLLRPPPVGYRLPQR